MTNTVDTHSIGWSIFLHIAPGLANLTFTVICLSTLWNPSLPPSLIYGVFTNVFVLIPIQLGYLFYLAKKRGNSGWSLEGIVALDSSLRLRSYLFWVPVILIPTGLIFALFGPITEVLEAHTPFNLFELYQASNETEHVALVIVLNVLLTGIVVPITEELYFRGYLLPRMPEAFGRAKPVAHSFMFAVYHFDTPWMIPVRTIGLLPLIYVAMRTNNTKPGIIAHCLVNIANFAELGLKSVRSA